MTKDPSDFPDGSPSHAPEVRECQHAEDSLREDTAQVRRLNAELEQRVAARTQELADANAGLKAEIARREQSEARAKYVAAFPELNPNPVLEVDASGKITFANPATRKILERLGLDPANTRAFLPNDIDNILRAWDKTNALVLNREIRVNGKVFGLSVTLVPELAVARIFGYDITDRKQAEQRVLQLNQELEQRATELEVANERLEHLATSLALDLRAPLVSLRSISSAIEQDYGAQIPAQARPLFQLIRANADEMEQLTQGLLKLMRVTRQSQHKQELQPAEMVRAAWAELQPEYEGRHLQVTIGELPTCCADPLLLTQVWVQLLSNALKATRCREHARIEIGARREGKRTVYFVRDNGVGFDMSYAGTIFRAFQRYHGAEEWGGSGVGLAIVESIVRRHNGRVWAEGAINQGATFYFEV